MTIPSEAEILGRWQNSSTTPIVSICCPTYNQEQLIESAIKGFLMQKTSFRFEIILRDDASQDDGVAILKRYQRYYPNIIKLILNKSNQLKFGHKSLTEFAKQAKGKFIALCDGDDFWQNPFKLQKQYDIFEKHDNVSICFHSMETDANASVNFKHAWTPSEYEFISQYQVISNDGGFMPTSSIMFRNKNISPVLEFIRHAPVGDSFLQFYLSFLGDVVFLKGSYGIRRENLENSWSSRKSKPWREANHHLQMGEASIKFLNLTPWKYRRHILNLANLHFLRFLYLNGILSFPRVIGKCKPLNLLIFTLFRLINKR